MTYEEAKAEFFKIAGIELTKTRELILDTIYSRHKKDPGWIIANARAYRGDEYDALVYLALAIEDFRKNEEKQKMTYEQAHKILENLLRAMTYNRLLFSGDMLKAIGKAVEAVELQIPKKPYIDNENGVYEKEYCPTCHRSLFPNDHHCRCGQALDWSDEDTKKDGKSFDRMYFDEFKQKEN